MGLWLIDSDLNRYDFLTADIPKGFPVDIKRNLKDLAFSHGAKDIGDQKVGSRAVKVTSLLKGTTGGFIRMVYDCESDEDHWPYHSGDAVNAVLNTTYAKQGSKSFKLNVDASKSGYDYAIWRNTTPKIADWTDYQNDWIYLWLYIDTVDYLVASGTAVQFCIGTDTDNYGLWNYQKSELNAGWQQIKLNLSSPDSTTGTISWASIGLMQIWVNEIGSNTNDFNLYIDDMKIWRISYQAEFDDLMRQIGKQDLKFYKDVNRFINVESMDLTGHTFIIGDSKATVEMVLSCPDPFFYADTETTELTWTITSSPDTKDVFNEGNIDVYPVIEITASADLSAGIELKNQTDGDVFFSYIDSNFTSGKKLTVDCVNGTVDLDGTNTIRFFTGQFLRLLAGTNTLQYTGANCSIVIKHRDRWL